MVIDKKFIANPFVFLLNRIRRVLLQTGEDFFHTAHGFGDILLGSGIRQTKIIGSPESIARHRCDMTYFEDIHRQIGRGVYLAFAVGIPQIVANLGEEIECSLRIVYF